MGSGYARVDPIDFAGRQLEAFRHLGFPKSVEMKPCSCPGAAWSPAWVNLGLETVAFPWKPMVRLLHLNY